MAPSTLSVCVRVCIYGWARLAKPWLLSDVVMEGGFTLPAPKLILEKQNVFGTRDSNHNSDCKSCIFNLITVKETNKTVHISTTVCYSALFVSSNLLCSSIHLTSVPPLLRCRC